MISPYKTMWILIAFDLPVKTKTQMRIANKFRQTLKNSGFIMLQKSIYSYYAFSKERCDIIEKQIKQIVPDNGHICFLFFTDRMFKMTKHFYGRLKVQAERPDFFDTLL
ncbi:CRISPR-associated protein Cas2 [Elusimicrobium minutum Pei191]|uniref:CRISPR-associated endoribonuclease Cas2 n=1 Tax=Elusimicrobium minutum (strain Pei191) TaxID=445932 RepID=B2KB48_ELUMP|nr:CRISPR-associated endonuclease Cas2 [Elusimicrobium minutum]ACC97807.1 CRISPR-associated protein Cas2 [Elusimicrobium minutum Pei191]